MVDLKSKYQDMFAPGRDISVDINSLKKAQVNFQDANSDQMKAITAVGEAIDRVGIPTERPQWMNDLAATVGTWPQAFKVLGQKFEEVFGSIINAAAKSKEDIDRGAF